jgi:enoyl-CoA hydratase/carnithine racemase
MTSGELIGGEEAVRLGIADGLVPDGEDAVEYAKKIARTIQLRDAVHQTAMLRQYGPPMRKLITKSISNYVRLLRSAATRERMKRYAKTGEVS